MKRTILLSVLTVSIVLGAIAIANADSQTYSAPAQGTVTVSAQANPKITLTIDTPDAGQTVAFGSVDPEDPQTATVGLSVDSNKDFDLTVGAPAGDVALMGLTTTLASEAGIGKGKGVTRSDTIGIEIPYTTDPDVPLSATIQYTVAQ